MSKTILKKYSQPQDSQCTSRGKLGGGSLRKGGWQVSLEREYKGGGEVEMEPRFKRGNESWSS